jgi:arylsulfatase A-like enzyme/Flp pilus assembly protein TadD
MRPAASSVTSEKRGSSPDFGVRCVFDAPEINLFPPTPGTSPVGSPAENGGSPSATGGFRSIPIATDKPRIREKSQIKCLKALSVVAAMALSAAVLLQGGIPPAEDKPNVLLITIDTLRTDRLGCYGSPYLKTPEIDALAGRGVLFSRAFGHNPETLPSHTNIHLGLTALTHGVHDNINFVVRPEFLTLAKWLKGRGYATAAVVGAFPLDSRFGLTSGFDLYDDEYGTQGPDQTAFVERSADSVVERGMAWLKNRQGPWFLWVHCFDPHQPYAPPEPFRSQYRTDEYSGEVAYTDQALGKLFRYLDERRREDRTVVVLTADHGESLGEHGELTHGYFAYNSTLRIPLIVKAPGFKPGRVDQNASHIDIFPTVCELLGAAAPPVLQGISLVPAMSGEELRKRPIYFESLMAFCSRGWAPIRGFIEGTKKYMDSPVPELYDLAKDFAEAEDLAPRTDLGIFKSELAGIMAARSSAREPSARRVVDRETREKLRSLGYVASSQQSENKQMTQKDDLKVLLPLHNKSLEADSLISRGRIREAITLLQGIVAERPDFDMAYMNLANLLKAQGRIEDAVTILGKRYQSHDGNFKMAALYGSFLAETGRNDEAIGILKKELARIDYDPDAWNYLGGAYLNKKEYREAENAYGRALRLDENYPVVINNLGSLHLAMFLDSRDRLSLKKAVDDFRRAIRLDAAYASPYNGLGAALKMGGDLDGAIKNWEKAVELKPDFRFALFNLGLAHLAKGNKSKARARFSQYRDRFAASLSPEEKTQLEALLQKCLE